MHKIIHKKASIFFKRVGERFPELDFSEFEYKGCREKSMVICPIHGGFLTHANSIYQAKKSPCPKCGNLLTFTEFLFRANSKHKSQYTYDRKSVENSVWHDLINIKCKVHGWFSQEKGSHLQGSGCPGCYEQKRSVKAKKGIDSHYKLTEKLRHRQFIENAIERFGIRYDYSLVDYINSHSNVTIICPDHGEFKMFPKHHLRSLTGCLYCSKESFLTGSFDYEKTYKESPLGKEIGVFYKLLFTHTKSGIKFIKIGITRQTIEQRYRSKRYSDYTFEIIEQKEATNYECAVMENHYKSKNVNNRFYTPKSWNFNGRTECYSYDKEQRLKHSAIKDLRESLLQKQNGCCAICGKLPKRPVLDHDHTKRIKGTSYCRGVLCSNCNVFLALMENNAVRRGFSQEELPNILRKSAMYKDVLQTLFIHPSEAPKDPVISKQSFNRLSRLYSKKYPNKKKLNYTYTKSKKHKPKPNQKLTKVLGKLYSEFNIKPEFYKRKE